MIKLGTKKTISIKIIKYFGNYLSKIVHLVYGCLQKKCRFPCFSGNGICIDFLICQGYARSRAQGGCYRRKYGDGDVQDLSENCRYDLEFSDNVKELAEWLREEDEYADW